MPPLDVVIIAVYVATLLYVGSKALENMEDWAEVGLDQAFLKSQLEEQGLDKAIALKIPLKSQYGFEPIADLSLILVNQSDRPLHVDWDRCSLTNFAGRSRRVVRITPSMNLDLSRPQVFSVIPPGNTLNERIIAEDMLRPGEDGTLKIVAPLVDLSPVSALPEGKTYQFILRLVLQWGHETGSFNDAAFHYHALTCRFLVRRVPWDEKFPWHKAPQA